MTDTIADYSGHLAENPKVNYVNGDGRSYLARSSKDYDLVWFPAPDSYSATNAASAGAFVLSESYLYTSETIKSSLEHLRDNGILAAQFGEFDYAAKPNRTTRYVATAREALDELGIKDPSHHILVATSPIGVGGTLSTILVKRTRFTPAQVDRLIASLGDVPQSRLRYAPGHAARVAADSPGANPVAEVATVPNHRLDQWFAAYPYDVRPITDDGPFFWHFTPFDDVIANFGNPIDRNDFEDAVGERVLLLLLGVALAFAAVFLLLPFVAIRDTWVTLPRKARSALYFAALGLGFIFFEVTLIQRLTLFLGYPTYSLTVTLMSILIFTGIGALLSDRWKDRPRARAAVAARGDHRAHPLLRVRADTADRRTPRTPTRGARPDRVRAARAPRALPRHLHASRPRRGCRSHRAQARVRRVGMGRQRLRVRRRRRAHHDPRDELRLPRRHVRRARRVRHRRARAPRAARTIGRRRTPQR